MIRPIRLPLSGAKFCCFQDIETGEHGVIRRDVAGAERLVVAVMLTPAASMPMASRAIVATRLRNEQTLAALGMHHVGQQDHVGIGGGIHPHRRSGEAGVAVGADGIQLAAIGRIGRIDVPAQAAQDRLIGRRGGRREFANGQRGENRTPSRSPIPSIMSANLDRSSAVVKRPACPRRRPCSARWDRAPPRETERRWRDRFRWERFAGATTRGGRNMVSRHAQRLKDFFVRVFIQGLSAQAPYDFA